MNEIQKMIDDAVEDFRQKVEEFLKPLSDTQFRCVDTDGEAKVMDADTIPPGTTILIGDWEVFRTITSFDRGPWVDYSGNTYTSEEFVKMLRKYAYTAEIVYKGL